MGGSPIQTSGTTSPDFSSSAQSTAPVSTSLQLGGSTGPQINLGSTGLSSKTLIVLGVAAVILFFIWKGR